MSKCLIFLVTRAKCMHIACETNLTWNQIDLKEEKPFATLFHNSFLKYEYYILALTLGKKGRIIGRGDWG